MSREAPPPLARRAALGTLLLAGVGYVAWRKGWLGRILPQRFEFEPEPDLPGFRRLNAGAVTAGSIRPFAGIEAAPGEAEAAARAAVRADLCGALFRDGIAPGSVPVAYFFDYQCPVCRRLTPILLKLDGVTVSWHELSGLGPASLVAARASVAARAQGAFEKLHARMMRATFQVNEAYVRTVAASAGLDADRLVAGMASPETARALAVSAALASRLGLPGTPGLVVGRTVVSGYIDRPRLEALIEEERRDPGGCR